MKSRLASSGEPSNSSAWEGSRSGLKAISIPVTTCVGKKACRPVDSYSSFLTVDGITSDMNHSASLAILCVGLNHALIFSALQLIFTNMIKTFRMNRERHMLAHHSEVHNISLANDATLIPFPL